MKCRFCANADLETVIDLGYSPPSNAYLNPEDLCRGETHLPLRVVRCRSCWLVQTDDFISSEALFTDDYAYFSSTSASWLAHAKRYCDDITDRLSLGEDAFVVELAANDGYLLKNFVARDIPCLGIEPTAATANAARTLGVPVLQAFFGLQLAAELSAQGKQADLIIGNNVYAHVPDLNNFTAGIAQLLKSDGTITLEFPHLQTLVETGAFDTIYHEHYSYLSLSIVQRIFHAHGLRVWDVERLATHGGSLRVFGCHDGSSRDTESRVAALIGQEQSSGLFEMSTYEVFANNAVATKHEFLSFLLQCRADGRRVCAYGAAAKGNTLLNYAGVGVDLLPFVCDAAPAKQGKFLPGSHIPIVAPKVLREYRPDVVILLPWNLHQELSQTLSFIREWGGELVVAMPNIRSLAFT